MTTTVSDSGIVFNNGASIDATSTGVLRSPAAFFNTLSSVARLEWNSATDTYTTDGKTITDIHRGMRRCLMSDAGVVNYYLSSDNSNYKADGVTPSVLTGADGQVMVEIPAFYYRFTALGDLYRWEISQYPITGFTLHPAFQLGGQTLAYRYIGAYDASVYSVSGSSYIDGLNLDDNTGRVNRTASTGDKLSSVSGKYPMVGLTRAEFRTIARNRGNGTASSVFQQYDFYLHSALQLLCLVEYQSYNLQAKLGNGVTGGSYAAASSSAQTDSPHSVAGKSNSFGNNSCSLYSATRDVGFVSYRGIENWFGNCWDYLDGYNHLTNQAYINNNPSTWADDTTTNYTALGAACPAGGNQSYIGKHQQLGAAFLPSTVTGAASTFVTDALWSAGGNQVAFVGGAAVNGSAAGPFSLNVNYASAVRDRAVGARLAR